MTKKCNCKTGYHFCLEFDPENNYFRNVFFLVNKLAEFLYFSTTVCLGTHLYLIDKLMRAQNLH